MKPTEWRLGITIVNSTVYKSPAPLPDPCSSASVSHCTWLSLCSPKVKLVIFKFISWVASFINDLYSGFKLSIDEEMLKLIPHKGFLKKTNSVNSKRVIVWTLFENEEIICGARKQSRGERSGGWNPTSRHLDQLLTQPKRVVSLGLSFLFCRIS